MKNKLEYTVLGSRIAQARGDTGFQNQSDLASALKVKQQTVSRWEAGTSRPSASQISNLANLLKLNPTELLELAGYTSPIITSFDRPFPMDQLSDETFERFVAYIVDCRYRIEHPGTVVNRFGGPGHKQSGIDVIARLPNKKIHTFQCKRRKQFGPRDVAKAVDEHTEKADLKHLVLSRIASPQTEQAVAEHDGWVLWDKETLSHLIRKLPIDDQVRLVNIFFNGRLQELLGRSEPGPWLTVEEFFAPFNVHTKTFNHTYNLKGRQKEVAHLTTTLLSPKTPLILLIGSGGIGKSRILKEVLTRLEAQPAIQLRILSPRRDAKLEDLKDLCNGSKILVVDDAHDRDNLSDLMQYASVEDNRTCLLFATRPYAEARLKQEAAVANIEMPELIRIEGLSKRDSIELVKEVLTEKGPVFAERAAQHIVDHVGDSPLVAVMTAFIIAKEEISLVEATNADILRNHILGKFKQVLLGDLGSRNDNKLLEGMLDVLALVQPFHIEDPALAELLQTLKGIDKEDVPRLLRILHEGGIIYRRGHYYRLMPDLLGDYIIEKSCIGFNHKLLPFAERAFEVVKDNQLKNVLVNLGRMDWRLVGGDPANSTLLDSIWGKLCDISERYDPRLDAIRAVAIYQPRQALEFVENKIRQNILLPELAEILQVIAYNLDYTKRACESLWEMSKIGPKQNEYSFDKPINVLVELCRFEKNKSLRLCECVFEFAMALSKKDTEWHSQYSPLEIMLPILKTEITSTTHTSRMVTFESHLINYEDVKSFRERLIAHMIVLLEHPDVHAAHKAALAINEAFREPRRVRSQSISDSVYKSYDVEFEQTMETINKLIPTGHIQPVVLLTLAPQISWMTDHAAPLPQKAAKKFLQLLPNTLKFRLLATLKKGNGSDLMGGEYTDGWEERNREWIKNISAELKLCYTCDELLVAIEQALCTLQDSGTTQTAAYVLISNLITGDLALAQALIAFQRRYKDAILRNYLSIAVCEILTNAHTEGQEVIKQFLASNDNDLALAAALTLGNLKWPLDNCSVTLIKSALSSSETVVVSAATHSLGRLPFDQDKRLFIDLLKTVRFDVTPRLADEVFMVFYSKLDILQMMNQPDVQYFLSRLKNISEIEGYHIQKFLADLSEKFPFELIEFYLSRIDIAVKAQSYSFRPANFGPYVHIPLRFHKSAEVSAVLDYVWTWLREKGDSKNNIFNEHTTNLFEAIFPPNTNLNLAQFFDAKLDTSTTLELDLIGRLLRKAPPDFVFVHHPFVIRFLERCRNVDTKLLKNAISSLLDASMSGIKSGIAGEPFDYDIRQRDESKKVLAILPRLSPAFELYDSLQLSAERNIAEQIRKFEFIEDE